MRSQAIHFKNERGEDLSARLELPLDQKPRHFALFAHCFTCGKDLRAVRNLSMALSQQGFGVLRFDFTGLGESEGDFADSNFSSNVADILAAADYLEREHGAPGLLIGHSLGGTAVLMAAAHLPGVKAVATIGAPCDPKHVLNLIREDLPAIKESGAATVDIAGREFKISSQFIQDLEKQGLAPVLGSEEMRGKALLIMHSPQDTVVGVENARDIYEAAHHPKSFIGLEAADHLLSQREDSVYVGELIGSWTKRYLPPVEEEELKGEGDVVARIDDGPFITEIKAGAHHFLADEPIDMGGDALGPTPYELLASGLGACTAMTLKMYADRKKWPLEQAVVHLHYDADYQDHCAHCEDDSRKLGRFRRSISLLGDLSDEQRKRLLVIANKCPVHKSLSQGVAVDTSLLEQ